MDEGVLCGIPADLEGRVKKRMGDKAFEEFVKNHPVPPVREGSTKHTCNVCGEVCWLGPRQGLTLLLKKWPVMCMVCLINAGVQPSQVKNLGGE